MPSNLYVYHYYIRCVSLLASRMMATYLVASLGICADYIELLFKPKVNTVGLVYEAKFAS